MVEKPSTVDEAIAYVLDIQDTLLEPSEKQSLAAALAGKTDAIARRYFSDPNPELWVGALKELLTPTGILPMAYIIMTCTPCVCCIMSCIAFFYWGTNGCRQHLQWLEGLL